MNAILLDIDGVLITTPAWKAVPLDRQGFEQLNKAAVAALRLLLDQLQTTDIIISSSRRKTSSLTYLRAWMSTYNINPVQMLMELPAKLDHQSKAKQLLYYTKKIQGNYDTIVIIDDDSSLNEDLAFPSNVQLIKTTYHLGLTKEQVETFLKQRSSD